MLNIPVNPERVRGRTLAASKKAYERFVDPV